MTATLPPPKAVDVSDLVLVPRTRDGWPATEGVGFVWRAPVLTILSDWRTKAGRWGVVRRYQIEETRNDLGGRAFLLHRHRDDVLADPERVERYGVRLAEQAASDECDCKGQYSAETRRQACKHVCVLRHLLANGHLDGE